MFAHVPEPNQKRRKPKAREKGEGEEWKWKKEACKRERKKEFPIIRYSFISFWLFYLILFIGSVTSSLLSLMSVCWHVGRS